MSEQKAFLALYLDAPMQSWGYQSRFNRRTTLGYPTRSGVFGMLCAAMGVDWNDTAATLARLKDIEMNVLVFEQGGRLWDYHTVGGGYDKDKKTQEQFIVRSAEGKPRGTVLTDREYLEEARFGVILTGPEPLLKEIEADMRNPRWGVWFGRKSCIPADFICRGLHSTETEVETALTKAANGRKVIRLIREVQDFAGGTDTLMDRPLDFRKRDFSPRRVKVE